MAEDGVVLVPYRGRLGNRLAQYCAGRILAHELQLDLHAAPIPEFPNVQPLGERDLGAWDSGAVLDLRGHRLDVAAIVRARSRFRHVLVRGHFLRYENFRAPSTS